MQVAKTMRSTLPWALALALALAACSSSGDAPAEQLSTDTPAAASDVPPRVAEDTTEPSSDAPPVQDIPTAPEDVAVPADDTTPVVDEDSAAVEDSAEAPDVAPPPADDGPGQDTVAADTGDTADTGEEDAGQPALLSQDVAFATADEKNIAARFYRLEGTPAGAPGVLLIHQYLQSKEQWEPYIDDLTGSGWRVLALDLRGHGESDPQDGALVEILHDPAQAPLDVQAALGWLTGDGEADPSRIAVLGTSIGANLACVANGLGWGVELTVAFSARDTPVANLAATPLSDLSFSGLYCLAGALDNGGVQAATCETLMLQTSAPKEIVILEGTSAHGMAIPKDFPEEWSAVHQWLVDNL